MTMGLSFQASWMAFLHDGLGAVETTVYFQHWDGRKEMDSSIITFRADVGTRDKMWVERGYQHATSRPEAVNMERVEPESY